MIKLLSRRLPKSTTALLGEMQSNREVNFDNRKYQVPQGLFFNSTDLEMQRRYMPSLEGLVVCDMGCGPLISSDLMLRRGARSIVCIDVNPEVLSKNSPLRNLGGTRQIRDIPTETFYFSSENPHPSSTAKIYNMQVEAISDFNRYLETLGLGSLRGRVYPLFGETSEKEGEFHKLRFSQGNCLVLVSDLFQTYDQVKEKWRNCSNVWFEINPKKFDYIYFNFPFLNQSPRSFEERALMGPNFQVLGKFLSQAKENLAKNGRIGLLYSPDLGGYLGFIDTIKTRGYDITRLEQDHADNLTYWYVELQNK